MDTDVEYTNLEAILKKNILFSKDYQNNALMLLIKSSQMANKKTRDKLLDCIQVFSDFFQKTVMLRYIFCDNKRFLPTTIEHLCEEFAHNFSLSKDRNNKPAPWDPILEATAAWFSWKMFTLDQEEKTVLLHLVLEASANIFFQEAHKVMTAYAETDYFKVHSECDAKHEKMGIKLLENLTNEKYQRLLEVQFKGWDMLNVVCNRIAALSEK